MFQIAGKVAALDRREDGYAVLSLRREEAGLMGPEVRILVPPLVLARDGEPQPGERLDLGAQSMSECGLSRRDSGCLLVARYFGRLDPDDQGDVGVRAPVARVRSR